MHTVIIFAPSPAFLSWTFLIGARYAEGRFFKGALPQRAGAIDGPRGQVSSRLRELGVGVGEKRNTSTTREGVGVVVQIQSHAFHPPC